MALQLGATRDAFLAAGTPEDKANKAAEELAAYENRLAGVEARLTLPTWMVGVVIAMLIPLLIKAFSH